MADSLEDDTDIQGISSIGPPVTKEHNKFRVLNRDGSTSEFDILDHDIQELYSQALINKAAYVCVYFPTKIVETKKVKDKDIREISWSNSAYFVINDGVKKRCLAATESWLAEHFKVNVMLEGNPRWQVQDYNLWLGESSRNPPEVLFNILKNTLKEYIEFDSEATYSFIILWMVGTYFYRLFDAFPYLGLTGTKRAGKSKVLEFLKLVCFNAIMSPDFTGSTVFRLIEKTSAVLLLDEAEHFKREKNEQAQQVRTLIMQGFLKDQSAYRTNTDKQFTVEAFNLYAPKAMAHINSFDDVLEDRCIQVIMKRATDKSKLNKWPTSSNPIFNEMRNYLYRLFLDYAIEIETYRLKAEETINVLGREKQLWIPILTLAYFFEGIGQVNGLVSSILQYAATSHQDRQIQDEQENQDLQIVRFLDVVGLKLANDKDSIKGNVLGWVPISVLYSHLLDEEVTKNIGLSPINPKFFTQKKLSHTLNRLGLKTEKRRGGYSWYLDDNTLNVIKARYGMVEPVQETLDLGLCSQGSQGSQGSQTGVDSTNECEGGEHREGREGKTSPINSTNECEGGEHREEMNVHDSSQGSQNDSGNYLITPKDDDED